MRKKFIILLLGSAVAAMILTGCSGDSSESASDVNTETQSDDEEPIVVKLGVTGGDKDMWEYAKEYLLDEKNIDLQFVEFTDYTTPNNALANGEIDLNSFQHKIYLDSEIEEHGYEIEAIGYTVLSPLNIFSDKAESIDEIQAGDVIAIPNDATNEGRALKVLENAGLITLQEEDTGSPTLDDIGEYKIDIEIKEMSADTLPSVLPDVAAAVINENYARDYGLKKQDAIYLDEGSGAESYWNLIAARSEDLKDPERIELFRTIVDAFHQDGTRKVLEEKLDGANIPVGWDIDLLADKE